MASGTAQKIRRMADAPWSQKGALVWILSPFLLPLWIFWSLVSGFRRIRGYRSLLLPSNIEVGCVGNVLMGGSGKSPIVRALAQLFLDRGHVVVIAARGVGGALRTGFVPSSSFEVRFVLEQVSRLGSHKLSDENREHFELLTLACPEAGLALFQGASRRDCVKAMASLAKQNPNVTFRVILDDGLQHFQVDRSWNICVWDPWVVASAPPLCFPFGPYREDAFFHFSSLFHKFEFNFWSRCMDSDLSVFCSEVTKALGSVGLSAHESRDVVVSGSHSFFLAEYLEGRWRLRDSSSELIGARLKRSTFHVVTGIARGGKFVDEMLRLVDRDAIVKHLELDDHGGFTQDAAEFLANSHTVVITAKDYFRWCDSETFRKALASKALIVVTLSVSFFRWHAQGEVQPWCGDVLR
jgi:tetraacyldisaccharide 4'-kinase